MANLPSPPATESTALDKRDKFLSSLAVAIHEGESATAIARRMAPGDKTRQRSIRRRIRKLIVSDPDLQREIGELAQIELLTGLGKASRGLVRAAGRGRTDAAKLVFSATGFHQEKINHDHTGEVKLTLNIPRPPVPDDEGGPTVVDADVVEDTGTG